MKGKKFLVEYLNGWWDIYEISSASDRKRIRAALEPIVARVDVDSYHSLATCPDEEFKQDVISYLSGCVLLGQFGFDTTRYRREIDRVVPRVVSPRHLQTRGVNNTMGITYRLRQLGYGGSPSFSELWGRPLCVCRTHPDLTGLDLDNLLARQPVYDMTHEIFYLTEFGETPFQCGSKGDLEYVRRMHAALIPIFIQKKDIDALAELVMDLNYLHWTDLPEYRTGRDYLLQHQNPNGSWGDPKHIDDIVRVILQVNPAYLPEVGQYLHTTEVTLNALCHPLGDVPGSQPAASSRER